MRGTSHSRCENSEVLRLGLRPQSRSKTVRFWVERATCPFLWATRPQVLLPGSH